jgi:hypothetical protein
VKLLRAQSRRDAQHVGAEVIEAERPFVILGIAVAARIRRGDSEVAVKVLELRRPIAPVAADAVQKKDELARARDRDREPRRGFDENGVQVTPP